MFHAVWESTRRFDIIRQKKSEKIPPYYELGLVKGHLISKANCQAVNSYKKRTNEFVFTTMRRVFVCFLEEIEDSKKAFRNYLTFTLLKSH